MECEIVLPGRPLRINTTYAKHWRVRQKNVAEIRGQAVLLWAAAGVRRLLKDAAPLSIIATHHWTSHRPDVGACMPAVKAAIDALVDLEVIADDDPDYVAELTFRTYKDDSNHVVIRATGKEYQ